MKILVLCFSATFQAWGERAEWGMRDTAYIPTKSGVIGLLAAARGVQRADSEILRMTNLLHVSVRTDKGGSIISDYQTTQGKTISDCLNYYSYVKKHDEHSNSSTRLSDRQYLDGSVFLVAVTGDKELLDECAKAVQNPHWVPYLGRKCCIPNAPIFYSYTDEFESVLDMFKNTPMLRSLDDVCEKSECESKKNILDCEIEEPFGEKIRYDVKGYKNCDLVCRKVNAYRIEVS